MVGSPQNQGRDTRSPREDMHGQEENGRVFRNKIGSPKEQKDACELNKVQVFYILKLLVKRRTK